MQTSEQKSNKRVAILIDSYFEDTEFLIPYNALKSAGAEVAVLGSRRHVKYTGKQGNASVTSDASTTEALPDAFDAIVIPGGLAPDSMRTDMKTVRFVQYAFQQGKLVGAICHGPQVLIEADLLRGKSATGFRSIRKDMQNAGANYVNETVVIDNNLITARRPSDLPQFTTTLLRRLGLTPAATTLPDEHDRQAQWWKLAAQWGGTSKEEIVAALNNVLQAERYALDMCSRHLQKTTDEAVRTLFEQLCTDARSHIQSLTARLAAFEASPSQSTGGAAAAQQDWSQTHDIAQVLLHVLDHIQARVLNTYRLCNMLTDPATVDILDQMEVALAKNEKHVADLYRQKLPARQSIGGL